MSNPDLIGVDKAMLVLFGEAGAIGFTFTEDTSAPNVCAVIPAGETEPQLREWERRAVPCYYEPTLVEIVLSFHPEPGELAPHDTFPLLATFMADHDMFAPGEREGRTRFRPPASDRKPN